MHLMPVSIFFDNCKRLSVTQGESLSFQVKLYDEQLRQPVNLTGFDVTFSVPGTNGQSIKRSTKGTFVDLRQAKQGDGETVFYAAHGFVTGDVVEISANATDVPAPFIAGGQYRVTVIDSISFTLVDVDDEHQQTPVILTDKSGTVTFAGNLSIAADQQALLGTFSMALPAEMTAQMAAMQGQDYQLMLIGGGMTRIYTGRGQLDVFAQSAP